MDPGTLIPPLERRVELPDMIAYAGATWDWHRLHYAPEGLNRPVVDGQLFGALLAEQLQDWLGPTARLVTMRFRFMSMVFAGETVRCTGRVTGVENGLITVEQQVEVVEDGRIAVAPAGAEVRLAALGAR